MPYIRTVPPSQATEEGEFFPMIFTSPGSKYCVSLRLTQGKGGLRGAPFGVRSWPQSNDCG